MLTRAAALSALLGAVAVAPADPPAAKPPLPRQNFVETFKGFRQEEGAKEKTPYTATFEMVYVPGGEFDMGSPAGDGVDPIETPRHRVKVGGFWMGKCEVTWDTYDSFWNDADFLVAGNDKLKKLGADAVSRPTNTFVDATYGHGRDGHPALCMTHHAAMMYCHWLRDRTRKAYRLPTEAEWEYAARAGKGDGPYWFGDDPAKLADHAWYKDNSLDEENFPDMLKGCTHKVGTKKPNPFGLHDLYGNVWEWTLDQYDPDAYANRAKSPLSIRPVAVPTDKPYAHVVRGGSWADKADRCRSAARRVSDESWKKWDPQQPQSIWWLTRMDVIGFRVVLAEDEQPELVGLRPKVVKKSE